MKTLTTTLLVLSISITALMTTTVYAAEKEHEHKGTSNAESQGGHDHMQKMHEQWAAKMMQPQWGWQKGIDGNYKKE